MITLLCSFSLSTGWRIVGASKYEPKVSVFTKADGTKLLCIPACRFVKPGRFCNPKNLALEEVRARMKFHGKVCEDLFKEFSIKPSEFEQVFEHSASYFSIDNVDEVAGGFDISFANGSVGWLDKSGFSVNYTNQ